MASLFGSMENIPFTTRSFEPQEKTNIDRRKTLELFRKTLA